MREDPLQNPQLESLWKRRLEGAKQRLDFTYAFVIEVELDDSGGRTSVMERRTVYDKALQSAVEACNEYCDLLQIYVNLLAHGVIPDEAQWLHSRIKKAAGGRGISQ